MRRPLPLVAVVAPVAPVALVALVLLVAPAAACTGAECYAGVRVLGESPATGGGVFRFPQAVAYAPGGAAVFAGDQHSGVVQRFTRAGDWQLDIGAFADARQPGRIGVVGGLATDRAGHLYVLDSQNDRIQVFAADTGRFLAAWGSTGTGLGRFRLGANTGAGGIAIDQPSLAVAPVAYVADQDNDRVQAFRLVRAASADAGGPVLPAGAGAAGDPDVVAVPAPLASWGTAGDCSATGCPSPAFDRALNRPQGVAVDPVPDAAGRRHVLVADDDNHRVVEYLPDGTFVRQVGGFGTGPGQFRFPYDVGIDAGAPRRLYVADNNNHRVQAFDAATLAFVRQWGGFGPQPGGLEFPRALGAVADDPGGGVSVADTANNRIQAFDPAGTLTAAWGIAGRGPGYVTRPGGVAVDAAGVTHVADTLDHRLERLALDGAYAGQSGYIAASSGFAAPAAGSGQYDTPGGVAYDARDDSLWVADTGNDRVQHVTRDGVPLAAYGRTGPAAARLRAPRAVAIDPAGGVLVADTGDDRVARIDPATGAVSVVETAGATLTRPAGVAAGADGTVYVADTAADRIVAAASGAAGAVPPPPGGLDRPTGLFLRGDALYVADTGHSRVLRRNLAAGTWDVIGGPGTAPGGFTAPTGVATDASGATLVVADTGNDRVQRFTLSGAEPPATVHLDASVTGGGHGTVTSAPAGIACPTDCRQGFSAGSTVALVATPAPGSVFAGWSGACAGGRPCTVAMAAPATVGAAFEPATAPAAQASRGVARRPRPVRPVRRGARDRTRPVLRRVSLRPARFRAAGRGSPLAPTGRGALLRYAVTERATLTLRVRRVGRRGRAARVRGVIRVRSTPGPHGIRLSGRLGGRTLRPARYRLVLSAVDAAGNRSRPRVVPFRIVR